MKARRSGPAYLVRRLGWRPGWTRWGTRYRPDAGPERRAVPLVVCTRRETAERRAVELDAEAHAHWRPFDFAGADVSLSRVEHRLLVAGIDPDLYGFEGFTHWRSREEEAAAWWRGRLPHWSADDRSAVWRAVGPPLHDVVSIPFEE